MEALPVLLFTLLVITLVFSTAIYMVEPRHNIETLPRAMWLVMVTMTTVGYGDVTPESVAGSLLVAVLVIGSVLYMAMPIGIIGEAFTRVWQDRDRILLMEQARERLVSWGFTCSDVSVLFESFDQNRNGQLNYNEFYRMIRSMNIGLPDERIVKLFNHFDVGQNGFILQDNFIQVLFPSSYHMIADYEESYVSHRDSMPSAHGVSQSTGTPSEPTPTSPCLA